MSTKILTEVVPELELSQTLSIPGITACSISQGLRLGVGALQRTLDWWKARDRLPGSTGLL